MAYRHKLSCRLALLRDALAVAVTVALVATCQLPIAPTTRINQIVVVPATLTLDPAQKVTFAAYGRSSSGDTATVPVSWSATGGTIGPTGLYTADTAGGDFLVTATSSQLSLSTAAHVHNNGRQSAVASVTVSPPSATVTVGQTAQLAATPKDASGNALTGLTITWATSDAGVAAVSASGLVTGVAAGSATITATAGGQSGTSTATVTLVPVASVTVSPAPASVTVGSTVQLTATPKDAGGNPLTGRVIAWATSNAGVATVSGTGLVTGVGAGAATMTATSGVQSGTSVVTVTVAPVASVSVAPAAATVAVGRTVQLGATPKDASGNPLTGRTITWATSNAGVATVSSTGLVTSVATGAVTITATSEGQSGTSTVTVTLVPVASVTVSPAPASVQVGLTTQLTATPKDASGNVLTGRTITWATSNASVATVSGTGLVTGVAGGSVTITATSEGQSGTSTVTVTLVPVASVTVSPAPASVQVGLTTQLTATPKDASGNVLTGRTITWATSNAGVATVSASGLVTGVAAGSATITATAGGQSGTSTVTVTLVPVASVTVSPATVSVQVGLTTQLAATLKDASGNVLTGRTITWATSNAGVATVSASGLVTGVAAGSATITATAGGQSGQAAVSVTASTGGGTVLFQESFEDNAFGSRGWYDNLGATITSTDAAPGGGTSSLLAHFAVGATSPDWGGAMRHLFTATPTLYVSYWVKYSANWVGSGQLYHPHEFYVLSDLDGDYDGPSDNWLTMYIEHNYQNGGIPRLAMQDNKAINTSYGTPPINLIAITENRSTGGCNGVVEANLASECYNAPPWYNDKKLDAAQPYFLPTAGPGYKGNWNHVETYFQMNSIVAGVGQADGVMQYWFNGTLLIDRHDIMFRTGARPNINFHQFIIAPYIGDGSPVDQTMWVDNIVVATSHP